MDVVFTTLMSTQDDTILYEGNVAHSRILLIFGAIKASYAFIINGNF
jgi:hypothetical protein